MVQSSPEVLNLIRQGLSARSPLANMPWQSLCDNLILWAKEDFGSRAAFAFDLLTSLAYIDVLGSPGTLLESCPGAPHPYNAHVGFINLCAGCYGQRGAFQFQRAAKPPSGAIGRITSEIILRFIELLYDTIAEVHTVGGVDSVDAIIKRTNGEFIAAEIKASPLLTYPLFVGVPDVVEARHGLRLELTATQFAECPCALGMHGGLVLPLGHAGSPLWPFTEAITFITSPSNAEQVQRFVVLWQEAKAAYVSKDKESPYFFLTNACGKPPQTANVRDGWPSKESVSDSKTSAGMDRTDDIKKGIYQTLKIGAMLNRQLNIKTAIISNLPALRHACDYVDPIIDTYWIYESDVQIANGSGVVKEKDLHRHFDYLLTLDDPMLRGEVF
jgi:hypothetical protein